MRYTRFRTSLLLASGLMLAPALSQAATYGATAIVAQSGGDYTDPVAAMADVGTWCGTPSDANRCLVKMMAGSYDISGSVLEMQSWVDVLGSGEGNTVVTGSGTSYGGGAKILVRAVKDATLGEMTVHMVQTPGAVVTMGDGHLRDMTVSYLVGGATTGIVLSHGEALVERVKVRGSGYGWMTGIHTIYNASMIYRDVDVRIEPSTTIYGSTCVGIHTEGGKANMNGIWAECRDATSQNNSVRMYGTKGAVRDLTALAVADQGTSGMLIRQLYGARLLVERATAKAINRVSGGTGGNGIKVFGTGPGSLAVRNSVVHGTNNGLLSQENTYTVLTNSNVVNGVNVTSGTVLCGGNTDLNGGFFASVCP